MDDMPGMIDTFEVSKPKVVVTNTSKSVTFDFDSKFALNSEEVDFKLILSKKKRREKNRADLMMCTANAAVIDEIEQLDENNNSEADDSGEEVEMNEENVSNLAGFEKKSNSLTLNQKFKFPPLTGEKLMVSIVIDVSCGEIKEISQICY